MEKIVNLRELLLLTVQQKASDLHLTEKSPPIFRIDGRLVPLDSEPLNRDQIQGMIYSVLSDTQKAKFEQDKELDFSLALTGLDRFRVNVHIQRGSVEAALRRISLFIPSMEELQLPPVITDLARKQNGLVLVTGPTGTGKTRTAAALIDLVNKAGWNKRTLFLADRNSLVRQAKNAFNNYLPHLPAIDLTKEKEDDSSRVVFSTYQTLINLIDGEFLGEERFYGIGHFDTVIFDEIHRTVYNKYKVIFKYFDALKIGLTATPSSQGDRDTYDLFGLEPHNPTYAYELEKAVDDKYLVPFQTCPLTTKFQRKGIKYSELSEEEKIKFEEEFADPLTGEFPDEIDATALNEWLFNIDTVDKVIGCLMENGIKVNGGDTLGKTIIFAKSHNHAQFIEQRFFRIQHSGSKPRKYRRRYYSSRY